MYYKNIILCLWLVSYVTAAPAELPPEKQQPTVIPIVSQSEEFEPNGTYKFSYETGNGIKREEIAYEKVLPKSRAASSNEASENEDYSDEIHVQQGSYSYTAPDGTIISLRYIADENGFQPIGDHLPKSPLSISASPSSGEKSGRALKSDDSSVSASGVAEQKASKPQAPQILSKPDEPSADVAASPVQDVAGQADAIPADAVPADAAPANAAPVDAAPADAAPVDAAPADAAPADAAPANAAPVDAAPVDAAPADAAPVNAAPADAAPAEASPADAAPADAAPADAAPADAAPADAAPADAAPADAAPADVALPDVAAIIPPQNAIQSEVSTLAAEEKDKPASEGEPAAEDNNEQSIEAAQQPAESEVLNASDASPANVDVSSEAASPVPVQSTESEQGSPASAEQAFISTEQPSSSELSEPSSSTSAPEQSSSTEAIGQSSSTEVAYQPSAEEAEQSTKIPQPEESIASTVSD